MNDALPAASARKRVARGFDRLSAVYEPLAAIASLGRIQASQTALAGQLPGSVPRALVVGGGSGRFLARLSRHPAVGEIVAIDLSPAMIERSRRRLGDEERRRVSFRCGGVEAVDADERFDLICTHYFLDLFEPDELRAVMKRLDRALAVGGRWWCSDFSHPDAVRWPTAQSLLLFSLYRFFGWSCGISARRLPDLDRAFEANGMRAELSSRHAAGTVWSAIYRREPRGVGARSAP